MPLVPNFRRALFPAAVCLVICWLSFAQPGFLKRLAAQDSALRQSAVQDKRGDQQAVASAEPQSLSDLKTVAESSNYRATANGAESELFLKRLARRWSDSRLESIGTTVEGRTIWALIVEPENRSLVKPLTVLLLGGIHSGECDGKEALLALARDCALEQTIADRKQLRLIFVPNFNADGNERSGPYHRPGQVGPEAGAGIRENAQGLDLNRDFIKLESPEVRGLVSALNRFDVDVLIDTHTTNGSLHRYDLTYAIPQNPAAPRGLDDWLREQLLPTVTKNLESSGVSTFYYGNFDEQHANWKSFGHEPRYSTELMGLRGKIGILVESYSYATYQRRIEATSAFVKEVLKQLTTHNEVVRDLIDDAAQSKRVNQPVALRGEMTVTKSNVLVRGYQHPDGSRPKPPYDGKSAEGLAPHDYNVELWGSSKPTLETKMPYAYAAPPEVAWALSRLLMQGIEVERLNSDVSNVACQRLQISKVDRGAELQKHALRRVTAKGVATTETLTAGIYLIRTSQPLGKLAAYLLEPESEDGLAAWNFYDPDLRAESEFPILRVLDDIPADRSQCVQEIQRGEKLTLDHLMRPGHSVEYSPAATTSATWLGDSNELIVRRDEQWLSVDPATGSSRPSELLKNVEAGFASLEAFNKSSAGQQKVNASILSSDLKYGMLTHQGDIYFYDVQADTARQLTHSPKEDEELAELSPTGKHVAFVRDNDLYVVNCQSTEERRLTQDGSDELLNGKLDWVYQEELYGRGQFKAFWFSPDGERLAFLQLDQSPVLHYRVPDSISYQQNLEDTRYPKAGDPLPIARMWIADIESGHLRQVDLSSFPPEDRLVVRVTWSPANELWLQVQNRIQNEQVVLRVDAASGQSERMLDEKRNNTGWIEVLGQPKFLPDGNFLWLSDLPHGRRHLLRFDVQSRNLTRLTSGDWDVAELHALSSDGRTAFVTGNFTHPTEIQLLSVDTQSGWTKLLTQEPGMHRPRFSHDGRFYIDTWSSLDQPPRTVLKSTDNRVDRVLAAPLSDRYRYVDIAPPQMHTIRTRDGLELQAMVLLPPGWESKPSAERLPVLFHVYGGPQAPTVSNVWQAGNYWWHQYLCSQGYAVVLCDNRSSRGRGIADTWKIYRDFGRVELEDLEAAVDWVGQQPWADRERVGLWGWSYGGYMTAYALTHSQHFKAGIAGAPVTDWHNYDAIYTERYMDLPKNNPEGYKSSSAVVAAEQLHGRLLLIHGERDDNVHMSNALQLAYALQKSGSPFDMMIYPKNRHGVVDPAQKYHLYKTMTEFLERHLKN